MLLVLLVCLEEVFVCLVGSFETGFLCVSAPAVRTCSVASRYHSQVLRFTEWAILPAVLVSSLLTQHKLGLSGKKEPQFKICFMSIVHFLDI